MKRTVDEKDKQKFLEVLKETANVRLASEACGYSRKTMALHKKRDKDFSDDWDEAMENAVDLLEREAWRRAFEGVNEPVMYQGKVIGQVKKYSDRLIEFLLAGQRPEKYGKQRMEMTGKDGKPLFNENDKIDTARRIAFLLNQAVEKKEEKKEAVH